MTKPSSRILSACCLAGIITTLLLLKFLPPILTRSEFLVEGYDATSAKLGPVPMEKKLPVTFLGKLLEKSPTRLLSLGEIAKRTGRSLVVNFWATWCPPCLEELPSLETLGRQLEDKATNVSPLVITVSVDTESKAVTKLFSSLDFKPSLPVLQDPDGEIARNLGTVKFPETYWVDAQGRVIHKWTGPQNWLSAEVLSLLDAPSS